MIVCCSPACTQGVCTASGSARGRVVLCSARWQGVLRSRGCFVYSSSSRCAKSLMVINQHRGKGRHVTALCFCDQACCMCCPLRVWVHRASTSKGTLVYKYFLAPRHVCACLCVPDETLWLPGGVSVCVTRCSAPEAVRPSSVRASMHASVAPLFCCPRCLLVDAAKTAA